MGKLRILFSLLLISLLLASCGEVKTPSRDEIPLIKEQVTKLQEGVMNKNLAAIDSVLSVDILKKEQSSDSLMKFIYGMHSERPFEKFGQAEIVYTDNFAIVESSLYYQGDTSKHPITFTFSNESGKWLLIDFTQGPSKAIQ